MTRASAACDPAKVTCLGCYRCGGETWRWKSEVARSATGRFFCSAECRNRTGTRPSRATDGTCPRCGTTFRVKPNQERIYCSRQCSGAARQTRFRRQCARCPAWFWTTPSADALYCSVDCAGRAPTAIWMTCSHCGADIKRRPKDEQVDYFCDSTCWVSFQRSSPSSWISSHGYRMVVMDGKTRGEHRVVMERILGRRLARSETVHHLDGDRLHNDPTNLALMISVHPAGAAIGDVIESLEVQLRQLRKDMKKLAAVGAGTTMRQSHLYSPDDPQAPGDLFAAAVELDADEETDVLTPA